MPVPEYFVHIQRLEERVEEGLRRLGAHFEKDSRSRGFDIQSWLGEDPDGRGTYQSDPTKLPARRWIRNTPIFDQGDVGSCTGNAGVGMISLSPLYETVTKRFPHLPLNEAMAVNVYGRATRLDALGPPYFPQEDRGSTTLGMLKALRAMGLIDEYRWGFGLVDALNILAWVGGPCIGIEWFEGFDEPTLTGELKISGSVRGGHELVLDEIDPENRLVWGDNSWGPDWDEHGRFSFSWDTLGQVLEDQGEVGVGVYWPA